MRSIRLLRNLCRTHVDRHRSKRFTERFLAGEVEDVPGLRKLIEGETGLGQVDLLRSGERGVELQTLASIELMIEHGSYADSVDLRKHTLSRRWQGLIEPAADPVALNALNSSLRGLSALRLQRNDAAAGES